MRQTGAGLLEMMIVIAMLVVFIVAGFRMWPAMRRQQHVSQLQNRVAELQTAARVYYFTHCANETWKRNIELKADALKASMKNPMGYDFKVELVVEPKPVRVKISTQMNLPESRVKTIRNTMSAGGENSELVWMFLPRQAETLTDSGPWILNGGLQRFNAFLADNSSAQTCQM